MYLSSFVLVGGVALAAAEGCHGDNLLRAMERHNGTAYCSSLFAPSGTKTMLGLPVGVPTTLPLGPVSSACSCLLDLNSTSRAPCSSATTIATSTLDSSAYVDSGTAMAATSSPTTVLNTLGHSATPHTTFGGGYSFSFPDAGYPASTRSTCGSGEATTTVQVTETMVSTIYISRFGTSSSSTGSSQSFSLPSDGDSGGRPAPPPRTSTSLLTRGSSVTASRWVSTVTLVENSTVGLSTSSKTSISSTSGASGVTTIISGNSTITSTVSGISSDSVVARPPATDTRVVNGTTATITGAPLPTPSGPSGTPTISSLTNTRDDGASSWTLSWMSSSSGGIVDGTSATSSSKQTPPVVTTVTSEAGGVDSTVIITTSSMIGVEPFPNGTSISRPFASSDAPTGVLSVITSITGGVDSTWTVIGGSTVTSSPNRTASTSPETPSQTFTGDFTVITSVFGGVGSTWTVIGGSTVAAPSGETTTAPTSATPSRAASDAISVITSTIGGVGSTWTLIGGSTVTTSSTENASLTPPTIPSRTVSVISSVVGGVGSTWTVIGGSTLDGSSIASTTSANPRASETATDTFTVVTSVVGGEGSTWTLIGGSTLVGSPASTSSPAISLITSVIGGVASTWTVIGGSVGSTATNGTASSPTRTAEVSVATSVVGGVGSTWTVIGGSTITGSPSATSSATPTLPPGATVITSIIGGVASSWTVIGGSTIFGSASTTSATPTAGGATVITSLIGGIVSSWTVIGGSTIFGSESGVTGSPVVTASPTVFTSVIDGVASTWTVIGGSTILGTLTQTSTSIGSPNGSVTTMTGGGVSSWTLSGGTTFVGTLNGTAPVTSTVGGVSETASASATTSSSATTPSGYASSFTGISIVVAQNASICYTLPTPTTSLHESLLNNTSREPPYIDAFYLNSSTNSVKYLRLRDNNSDPILLDVSDPSKLAIVDKDGDVLSIDSEGLHFTAANCSPKIDVFISGFFQQLNTLTKSTCGDNSSIPVNGTDTQSFSMPDRVLNKRQEQAFDVVLHLKDQCGNPVRADFPVSVSLGDTECVVLPRTTGDFVANCAFPGGESDSMECETSVQQTLDHLTKGSLAGTCPSSASVWGLLFRELGSVVNVDDLLKPFLDAGLDLGTDLGRGIISVIDSFIELYDFSISTLKNSTSEAGSDLGDMIEGYGVTAIRTDVCRSLRSSETLNLTLVAGTSTTPVPLASISTAPSPPLEYERNVTDPMALACCPNPSKCIARDGEQFYPPEASIEGSDCLCGTTLEGRGIGFRTGKCTGYNQCNATSPCAGGAVCLVDSCCGFNVCVNGTECSAPRVGRRWVNLSETETTGGMF